MRAFWRRIRATWERGRTVYAWTALARQAERLGKPELAASFRRVADAIVRDMGRV